MGILGLLLEVLKGNRTRFGGIFSRGGLRPRIELFRICFAVVALLFGCASLASAQSAHLVGAIPELSPSGAEAEAIFKLASRLEAGDAALPRDDVLARRLYRIAAEAGHSGAQCNLGAMLMDGTGGPTDLAGGAALFRKAALRGHGLAQYNVGVMYALGDGVVKDSGEAMAWIEQSITRLPEGEALTSAKAWREHLRNRMSSREGMTARARSQELGEAVVRELAVASTGSSSRAARAAVRSGLEELGLSPDAMQRLGLASVAVEAGSPVRDASVSSTAAVSTQLPNAANSPTLPVEAALQEWLRAWSDRRVDDYLGFYDSRYAPLGGVDRAVWVKNRRSAIRRPSWVKVRADQISTIIMSAEEYVVSFDQTYTASTGHREKTRKTMIWLWSGGRWKIVSEQSTPLIASSSKDRQIEPVVVNPVVVNPVVVNSRSDSGSDPSFEPAFRAWLKAWADRQGDAYLAYYAAAFQVPGGLDRQAWGAERVEAMNRPAWIKVRADRLKYSVQGDTAEARFFQVFVAAPGSVEVLQKTMRWMRIDGRWQILSEQGEPIPRKHAGK